MRTSRKAWLLAAAAGGALLAAACGGESAPEAPASTVTLPASVTWDTFDLQSSADAFQKSLVRGDYATVIRLMTADGFASATALEEQLLGRDTGIKDVATSMDADGKTVRYVVTTSTEASTVVTHWVQLDGQWKVRLIELAQ
ncbi:MAG: hypothetical protein IT303_11690 [Dehalococcoidia bacterium]|nr:hypothetical protein [Dehalococcoidia bacterium]